MKKLPAAVLFVVTTLLMACSTKMATQSETTAKQNAAAGAKHNAAASAAADKPVLFADSMAKNWQNNWFLDGKNATLEHRDHGLYFAGGTITKEQDPEKYHAHHAVLWTKQEFSGNIAISFDMTRVDTSNYGTTLIYLQAQGIGKPPYEKDIYVWRELRAVPAMDHYFNGMNLLSISLRENIRCKRYPWNDIEKGVPFKGPLIEPMLEYDGIKTGQTYHIVLEKRSPHLTFTMYDAKNNNRLLHHTWDTSINTDDRNPPLIKHGRIGIRHMSTKQMLYKNFMVTQLNDAKMSKQASDH